MKFQTRVPDTSFNRFESAVDTPLLFMGSCFSDNIGGYLQEIKLPVISNPFGVMFNPVSVQQSLDRMVNSTEINEAGLVEHNGLWHHPDFHGSFSDPDKSTALSNMNEAISENHAFLKNTHHVFISLGTAFVYKDKTSGNIVANCHKMPADQFNRELLSIEEVLNSLQLMVDTLQQAGIQHIHFTVSPIRHLRDGLVQNQRSKAHLIAAVHQMVDEHETCYYFPSYEVVMDELRDYRFYAEDLTHLSQTAIQYLREKFLDTFYTPEAGKVISKLTKVHHSLAHKPLHPNTDEYRKFVASLKAEMEQLEQAYDFVSYTDEKNALPTN